MREDRVNEMASKDELNGGRKETRSGLALLIDSSQTRSFQRRRGVSKPEFLGSAPQKRLECVGCASRAGGASSGHTSRRPSVVGARRGEVRDFHTDGGVRSGRDYTSCSKSPLCSLALRRSLFCGEADGGEKRRRSGELV